MKKIGHFFQVMGFMISIVLYPIISFNWYRFCRDESDNDSRKFIWYGTLGVVGILGVAIMWFTPFPWKAPVAILASILYVLGSKRQVDLIVRKRNAASQN